MSDPDAIGKFMAQKMEEVRQFLGGHDDIHCAMVIWQKGVPANTLGVSTAGWDEPKEKMDHLKSLDERVGIKYTTPFDA